MKTFRITNEKDALHIEMDLTKMKTLERLFMMTAKEYIRKGNEAELKRLMARIEAMML